MRIVLDTNCLLASLSKRGAYFNVWRGLQEGKYTLCVSNEVLEEYEEIIAQKTNSTIASNVIQNKSSAILGKTAELLKFRRMGSIPKLLGIARKAFFSTKMASKSVFFSIVIGISHLQKVDEPI